MNDEWNTPLWIYRIFKQTPYFDPCTRIRGEDYLADNRQLINMPMFINPPYSNPLPFVLRAIEDYKKFHKPIILLLKIDTTTKWYKELVNAGAHFLYFSERLHYSESKETPPFCSMLAILSD